MSLFSRVASLAAMLLCVLGLSTAGTTASRAAEPVMTAASQSVPALSAPVVTAMVATTMTDPTLSAPVQTIPAVYVAPADKEQAPAAPDPSPAVRFASLEQAVAAQDEEADAAPEAIACLASAIYYEAKGEPLSGQLAVANVIINRAHSGRFPPDVCGVVTQRGQFSFVRDGHLPAVAGAARGYRTAVAVARVALREAWNSAVPSALFFHARRIGVGRGIQVAAIGNHVFYR